MLPFHLKAQEVKPVDVVKASLKEYNIVDIDLFMSYFSDDIKMQDFNEGTVRTSGREKVRAIFEPYFDASPNLHSKIVNRITFDNKVIDHELIIGARGSEEPFEKVVIYEVNDGLITNMVVVRKNK